MTWEWPHCLLYASSIEKNDGSKGMRGMRCGVCWMKGASPAASSAWRTRMSCCRLRTFSYSHTCTIWGKCWRICSPTIAPYLRRYLRRVHFSHGIQPQSYLKVTPKLSYSYRWWLVHSCRGGAELLSEEFIVSSNWYRLTKSDTYSVFLLHEVFQKTP